MSGTYTGEDGPGLLRQLQRNEFVRASRLVRRRYDLWVLSGTGTMFRVSALREVARERCRSLPGVPGEYYDSSSITEDYEILNSEVSEDQDRIQKAFRALSDGLVVAPFTALHPH